MSVGANLPHHLGGVTRSGSWLEESIRKKEEPMFGNLLSTFLYLSAAGVLGFMAWSRWFDIPSEMLWVGAGICLIVGLWRLLHLSQG